MWNGEITRRLNRLSSVSDYPIQADHFMTTPLTGPVVDPDYDAQRVAILKRLFQRMSVVLDRMIAGLEAENEFAPKLIVTKILELQSAHYAVLKAQEAFLEKQTPPEETAKDSIEDLRRSIGGKLDRIRASLATEGVSKKP